MGRPQDSAWKEGPGIFLLSLFAGFMVGVVAKLLARVAVEGAWPSIRGILSFGFAFVWSPLPVVLAASFATWAAHMRGPQSAVLALPLGLSPYAYWTYKAERGELLAVADGKWTAAALGPMFAWILCVASVTATGVLGVLLVRVMYDDPRDSS
jgi:hypothetical protein